MDAFILTFTHGLTWYTLQHTYFRNEADVTFCNTFGKSTLFKRCLYFDTSTVLPTKSDSDVCFVYKDIRDL